MSAAIRSSLHDTEFRRAEKALYEYPYLLRWIADRREYHESRALTASRAEARRQQKAFLDPTAATVTALAQDAELARAEAIVQAVEQVLRTLPVPQQTLIRLRYWSRGHPPHWTDIAKKLNVHVSTVYRWRVEIVECVATVLRSDERLGETLIDKRKGG